MMDGDKDIFIWSDSVLPSSTTSTNNNDIKSLKEQEHDLKNERYKSDTTWRCRLSWWVIIVDSVWLIAVLVILMLNNCVFELSDAVLITILGTTTINVLGLAYIILKGLFGIELTSNNKKQ